MSTIITRYAFWNPGTWSIPTLYWDSFSDEQRIHAICKQLGKVIAYADYLGINVDDIAQRLEAIEAGQLDQFIVDAIEQWFEDNQPAIADAIDALNAALPISEFDENNTVHDAISNLSNRFPINTADIADGAITGAKIATGAVTSTKIDSNAVTNAKIANGAISSAKMADGVISRGYLGVVGDSFSDNSSEWVYMVRDYLGYTGVINKAVAGSGFIRTGYKDFVTQFSELLADANFDKVTDIVIYGGVNDYVHTSQNIVDYASAFQTIYNAYNALPAKTRPKLYMVFGNCHSVPRKNSLSGYAAFCDEINTYLSRLGFAVVDGAKYWLLCELQSVDSGDTVHPNALGNEIIAGYMMQVLTGCYSGVVKRHKITALTNIPSNKSGFLDLEFNNGTISFYLATNTDAINDVTNVYTRMYTNANLYLEIGPVASYGSAFNMIKGSPALHVVWEGSSAIYYVNVTPAIYFGTSETSFGLLVDGSAGTSGTAKLNVLKNTGLLNSSTNVLAVDGIISRGAGN